MVFFFFSPGVGCDRGEGRKSSYFQPCQYKQKSTILKNRCPIISQIWDLAHDLQLKLCIKRFHTGTASTPHPQE